MLATEMFMVPPKLNWLMAERGSIRDGSRTFCSAPLTHQRIFSALVLHSSGRCFAEYLSYFWKNNFYFQRNMAGDTEMSFLVYPLSILSLALLGLTLSLFLQPVGFL